MIRLGLLSRCAALVVISCMAGSSLAQRSYDNPFLAQFDDGATCIGWDPIGGQLGAYYGISPDGNLDVLSAFQPIQTSWSLADARPILLWLQQTMFSTKATFMNIKMYTAVREATTKASLANIITSFTLPGGDVELKEARGLEMTAWPLDVQEIPPHGAVRQIRQAARKQKAWLCSNFRLRLEDLPTGNVVRTDTIKFKQEFGPTQANKKKDLRAGEATDAEVRYSIGDFSFDIPSSDRAAYDKEMVKALDGNPTLRTLEMDYLDENGNSILTVRMRVRLVAIGQTKMTTDQRDPNQLLRVIVQPPGTSPTTGNLELIVK